VEFVKEIIQRLESKKGPFTPGTETRMHGLLTAVSEELQDVPLFYNLPDLCSTLHCESPRLPNFKAALINAGYRASHFHKDASAVKTDAPPQMIWDILRCWIKKHPINKKRLKPDSFAQIILSKEPEHQADFALPKQLRPRSIKKAKRFLPNPESYWGPKSRARGKRACLEENSDQMSNKETEVTESTMQESKENNTPS